jgi:hypothetical protein
VVFWVFKLFLGGFFGWVFYCQPWFEAMLRDVLLSLVKLMFGGCGGSQEDLLAIQAACLKHIVLTVPDLVQAGNRQQQTLFLSSLSLTNGGQTAKPFLSSLSLPDGGQGLFFFQYPKFHPAFWTAVFGDP